VLARNPYFPSLLRERHSPNIVTYLRSLADGRAIEKDQPDVRLQFQIAPHHELQRWVTSGNS
jgi:hypothetical protein